MLNHEIEETKKYSIVHTLLIIAKVLLIIAGCVLIFLSNQRTHGIFGSTFDLLGRQLQDTPWFIEVFLKIDMWAGIWWAIADFSVYFLAAFLITLDSTKVTRFIFYR